MTVIGETPSTRERLNVALIEWQFVRISNDKLREVLNDFLDEHANADQLRMLSDPKLSDEEFSIIAAELFDLENAKGSNSRQSRLDDLPPIPEPIADLAPASADRKGIPGRPTELIEHPSGGVDWVALFYSIEDYICGCTGGWLSIARILGLLCLTAIIVSSVLLIEETPVQWKQAWEGFWSDRPSTLEMKHDDSHADQLSRDTVDSLSDDRETSSAIIERIGTSGTNANPEKELALGSGGKPNAQRASAEPTTDPVLNNPSIEKSQENQLDAASAALETGKVRDIIALIEEGSHQTAIEVLGLAVSNGEIRDNNVAKLLEIEASTRGGSEFRGLVWNKLMALEPSESPELCQLFVARWLLTSSVSERTEILLSTDTSSSWIAKRAVIWAEARGGSTDPETIANLKNLVKDSSFSLCDRIFLATSYFASKKDDMAYDLLIEVKDALRNLRFEEETDVVQWLRNAVISNLNDRLDTSVAKIRNRIGFPVSTHAN